MVHLINSSFMPHPGTYKMHRLTPEEWKLELETAVSTHQLRSHIGYAQNAEIIEQDTGITVNVNREPVGKLQEMDTLLIMRLPYRLQNVAKKGKRLKAHSLEDFELFIAYFENIVY